MCYNEDVFEFLTNNFGEGNYMRPVVKRPATIRLVILYIMDKYKKAVPETALSNIMLGDINVNYFDYREALAMLDKTQYIYTYTDNGHEYHLLTQDGKELIDTIYKKVAYQLRLEIPGFIKREKLKIVKSREYSCEITPRSELEYMVTVKFREADEEILSVEFFAGNRTVATELRDMINMRKKRFFSEISKAISETLASEPELPEDK